MKLLPLRSKRFANKGYGAGNRNRDSGSRRLHLPMERQAGNGQTLLHPRAADFAGNRQPGSPPHPPRLPRHLHPPRRHHNPPHHHLTPRRDGIASRLTPSHPISHPSHPISHPSLTPLYHTPQSHHIQSHHRPSLPYHANIIPDIKPEQAPAFAGACFIPIYSQSLTPLPAPRNQIWKSTLQVPPRYRT